MLTLTCLTLLFLYTSAYDNLPPSDSSPINQNDCPLWFHCNKTLHDCQCPLGSMFISEGGDPFVKSGYLTTYNHNKRITTILQSL